MQHKLVSERKDDKDVPFQPKQSEQRDYTAIICVLISQYSFYTNLTSLRAIARRRGELQKAGQMLTKLKM